MERWARIHGFFILAQWLRRPFHGGAITIVVGKCIRGSKLARLRRKNPVNDPERVDAFVYIRIYSKEM